MGLPTLPDWIVKWAKEALKQEVNYLVYYESNISDLNSQVEKLKKERQKLGERVAEDEDRNGREIYNDVSKWFDEADTIIDDCEKFSEKEDHAHAACFTGLAPNLLARYSLSKKSIQLKGKAESQLQKAKFDIISHGRGPPSVSLALSNVDYQSLPSRATAMEDIISALKDSSNRVIGVHGLSGVGKTTLVMEAVNRVQNDDKNPKLFDVVIMANVTKSPDIRKIQGQIADMLWMKLDEESEEGRASRIRERLKKEKESTLIILDDLSAKVDLNILGIPWQSGYGNQKNPNVEKSVGSRTNEVKETKQQTFMHGPMKGQKAPDASTAAAVTNASTPAAASSSTAPAATNASTAPAASSPLPMPTPEERHKGCKVLLISEVRQVLQQMDIRPNLVVHVDLLTEKDSRILFNKMAGIGDKNAELGELPSQIVKKCDGLPMSIVTTAKALKNRSPSIWKDTCQKLETQTLAGTPEHSTRVIYDLLENEELQMTFLLCACMGNDALVSDLLRVCIGLGFLQGIYTIRDARIKVQIMLMKLRGSGLLSKSYSSDRFTMQNLVRNAALSIAFKEKQMLTLTKGRIDEWPDEDQLRRYVAISLRHCDIIEAITKSMKCDKLQILEVNNDDPQLKLPDDFFKQMKELKVLILTGVQLSPLGSSLGCLTKLRMLCLEHCTLIPSSEESTLSKELSIIENLENLRILSFSGSNIDCLPDELGTLSKLQTLDISNCPKLRVIKPNIISRLTSLEELYTRKTPIQWPKVDGGENDQSGNASLFELGGLNQLINLDIQIESVHHLPENVFIDKFPSYKIIIGSLGRYLERDFRMPEKHELSRFLAINQKGGVRIHSQKGIKMLFERVEYLLLGKLTGVQDLFYELNLKGFPHLKYLAIGNNHEIKFLINPKDRQQHHEMAFEKLETLELHKVTEIEGICSSSCALSESSFVNLKIIKIKFCGQLKNLFFDSMLKHLASLETIEASDCGSLKEIIHVENANKHKMLNVSKLRTLTMQSLPEFSGFSSISTTPGKKILFHEKVEVSELERMELKSIQIDQIWNDQSSNFGNLIHLDVSGCHNLKYLLPLSLATNLKKLQSLYVSECDQMENIIPEGSAKVAYTKDSFFPNLKNINLSSMKSLKKMWNPNVPFENLDTLVVEKCDELISVFSHDMEGIFQGVSSLTVTNCKSMETIFDLTADDKKRSAFETKLRDVHLESLPELKSILKCKQDHEGTLQLKSLQNITVHRCRELASIFPFSIILERQLSKLQSLVVSHCSKLKEIVAAPNGTGDNSGSSARNPVPLEFPELTNIKFSNLPEFENFCPGHCELKCEKLDDLSIELCPELELFREEASQGTTSATTNGEEATTSAQRKPLFHEKVINKLRSMHIESQHIISSTRYRRDKLEVLRLSWLRSTKILYRFLHSNPNLKSLWLDCCSFAKLVVPDEKEPSDDEIIENIGVVPELKNLKLTNLFGLEEIGLEHDAILQRIESLILEKCPDLKTIVPSRKGVRFTFLTNLEVVDCEGMKYLMPLSTAKSLGQLVTMKVTNCESLEEIILSDHQGVGEEVNEQSNTNNIVFKQMKALELVSLKNLVSFCSSESCSLEFPLLEKLFVSVCPKMEKFSGKDDVKTTPTIMQKVYVVRDEENRLCWEGNLQDTIKQIHHKKKYFEGMDTINISEHLELEEYWNDENAFDRGWFYNLKSLTLEGCKFESCAIPSFVLRCLKNLKELKVRDCKNITFIFEINDIKGAFQLEKLTLEELPNVTHVWPQQDKPKSSRFRNLQQVTVNSCRKLKALFPVALARNLKMLEQVEVDSCDELLEIVEKDTAGGGGTENFVFPYLTHMELQNLPLLTHFYDGKFTLECPKLKALSLFNCDKSELFHHRTPKEIPSEDASKVEILNMRSKDISVLLQQRQNLECLTDLFVAFDDDVSRESSSFPFEILGRTPKLETMGMYSSTSLKEILFLSQNSCNGQDKFLGPLEDLYLAYLFKLSSIKGLESLSKLQRLYIYQCPLLETIEQYPPILTELNVEGCHGLKYLFTSPAARTLKHLEELDIKDCKSLKDIVRKERDDETATEEIIFERLESISLQNLESLECFYSGNAALKLPSKATIWKCPKMTIFSPTLRDEDPQKEINVYFHSSEDDPVSAYSYDDLNDAIGTQFLHQTHLVLNDYPEIKGEWVGSSGIPVGWSYRYLKSLVVEGCDFLTNAVLPSHLLPLLINLKELQVRKCNHVLAIFDVKDAPPTHEDPFHLNKIILDELPSLIQIWNDNDPKASLSFQSLEEVFVWECKSIKSLFPASVPRDNIQKLDVRNCGELEEIVANNEEIIIIHFPDLTHLMLWGLPKLSRICSGMQSLLECCSSLTALKVYRCPKLKVFAGVDIHQNSLNSNPGDQDCFATQNEEHELVSSPQKVTISDLRELVLSKEDSVTMIDENGGLPVELPNTEYLGLDNFNDNEFPDAFFSKMSSLPNLEEIELVDCAFKDIFHSKESVIDYSDILSKLTFLGLTNLYKLNSMGFEKPWMAPLLESLETLKILECNCLTNLASSSSAVSFLYLTELSIDNCAGLKYLFTSSTAKSLCALQKLSITKCKSLETVVAHDLRDEPEYTVSFRNLEALSLKELQHLESFYSGNSTLYFPGDGDCDCVSFTFTKCDKMKTFSYGDVLPKFLHGKIDEEPWCGNLNTAVQERFKKARANDPMTYMKSSLLISFVMLGLSANGTLKKKQQRTLELPYTQEEIAAQNT